MERMAYTVFQTKMGWVGILGSQKGITRTTLPHKTPEEARTDLGDEASKAENDVRPLLEPIRQLSDYFEGKGVEFSAALEYNGSTPFQERVWQATRRIPYGETRTYGEIAREAGSPGGARAAGRALGANPIPIIVPCHRVIGSDGSLTGFGGGVEMKRRLLEMEREATDQTGLSVDRAERKLTALNLSSGNDAARLIRELRDASTK